MKSKYSLNIKGRNINRFIKKLRQNKIEILKIKYKNKNEANIIIFKKDYEKLKKIKSIYTITELDVFGVLRIKKNITKNQHLIIIGVICYVLFIMLTNTIFKIEITNSNKELRKLVKIELEKYGIKKYSFKKNYSDIQKIKQQILEKHKNQIEWLEIETKGTKITVKLEERKIPDEHNETKPRNIIARKKGIIKKVIAEKGEIIKDMDDYVEKGDLIISGDLMFNGELKGQVRAKGKVYAEIWYVSKVTYPLIIKKEEKTGKVENTYKLKILNKEIYIPKKNKIKYNLVLLKHNILPIYLSKGLVEKTRTKTAILTFDEALSEAKKYATDKVKSRLKEEEYIIRSEYLKSKLNNSTIEVEMFFAVYEDITDYIEIEWCSMIRQSIIDILGEVWPTILISSVIIISMRMTYLLKNKKELVLYRELFSFFFIIYVLCLFYVVTFQDVGWGRSNYIPFKEMFRYNIGSRLFIKNVIGNIILFLPYGFFASYYLDLKNKRSIILLSLLVSLSIETTQQVIGRVFDIDDIILNCFGGLIGFYIYRSLDFINNHMPKILKNEVVYNLIIIMIMTVFFLYMFNFVEIGV